MVSAVDGFVGAFVAVSFAGVAVFVSPGFASAVFSSSLFRRKFLARLLFALDCWGAGSA